MTPFIMEHLETLGLMVVGLLLLSIALPFAILDYRDRKRKP